MHICNANDLDQVADADTLRAAEVPILRRLRDCDEDTWVETTPGSGRYHWQGDPDPDHRCSNKCGDTREAVARSHGPLVDLAPVPADAEAVR